MFLLCFALAMFPAVPLRPGWIKYGGIVTILVAVGLFVGLQVGRSVSLQRSKSGYGSHTWIWWTMLSLSLGTILCALIWTRARAYYLGMFDDSYPRDWPYPDKIVEWLHNLIAGPDEPYWAVEPNYDIVERLLDAGVLAVILLFGLTSGIAYAHLIGLRRRRNGYAGPACSKKRT